MTLQKYANTALSFFDVQTNASNFCMEPASNISADGKTRVPYCPTWVGMSRLGVLGVLGVFARASE